MLDYLDRRNENPKPFIWTADADLILGKVERLCKRISRSGLLAQDTSVGFNKGQYPISHLRRQMPIVDLIRHEAIVATKVAGLSHINIVASTVGGE
jgi:hypothetical protein